MVYFVYEYRKRKNPLLVTIGIIKRNSLFLIAQRKSDSYLEPSKWEFPGGKVETLEHPENSLKREIKEELNVEVSIKNIFDVNSHIYFRDNKKIHIVLIAYLVQWISGEAQNLECQDSKWVKINELQNYEFVAGDIPIMEKTSE